MKPIILFITTALALCGCARFGDHGFDRTKLATDAGTRTVIRLADYTAFEWDRVHIFAPYTPSEAIKEEVGSSVQFPQGDSEGHCLLVFLSRGRIAATFEIERKAADFAKLFQHGGYSRDEAVFAVETRGTDHWRHLKKKEPNH